MKALVKPPELRELVIEIATTTGFGLTRIIGELRELGIKGISRQTVRNILKEEGIQPGPNRTSDCWDNFIKRHAETLWTVDFFSVKTVTTRGLRDMYLMAFLCMSSREVIVTSSTEHPNAITEVIVKMGLKKLPLLPARETMHLMAKAAVAIYEAAVERTEE